MKKIALCCSGFALMLPSLGWADDKSIDMLMAMDISELTNVTVSVASKAEEKITEAPGIISIITDKDIERYGDKTLGDILNHLPSFHILSSYVARSNYSSIRGQSLTHYDNHTLILLNGRPMRDSSTGSMGNSIYRTFPVEAIQRVEVIRGPGSALYGTNAFAGVINIVTKDGKDQPEYRTDASYGSNNYRQLFASKGGVIQEANVYAAGRFAKDSGWDHRFTDEVGVLHDDEYDSGEYSGVATMDYKNLSLSTFSATSIEDTVGVVPIGSDIANKIRRDHLDTGYKLDLNEDLYVNTNFTLNHMKWYPSPNPALQSRDYLGEMTAHYQARDNLKLVAGQTMEYRDGVVTSATYNNHWYSSYGQVEYTPVKKLKLVGGGQYNKVEGADGSFVPRFGAIYNHNERLGAKLLYGEAFRGAAALESDIVHPVIIGNSSLTPEKIRTYDATVFYNTEEYNLGVTYFNSKMTDIISRVPATPPAFTYANAGEVSTDGVELEAKWYVSSRWRVEANATFQSNKDGSGAANATADSNTMLKGGITYNTQQGVVLSAFDSYFDEAAAYTTAAQVNPPADAYHLVSATVNLDLHELAGNGFQGMQFTLYGANLLDEDIYYPEFARQRINTLPQASGRLLYGTFSVEF